MIWKRTEGVSLVTGNTIEVFEPVEEQLPIIRGEIDRSFIGAVSRALAWRKEQPRV